MSTRRPIDAGVLGAGVAGLDAADAERLAALVDETIARQSRALDRAIDGGMAHIPRLLRGTVKAMLFR